MFLEAIFITIIDFFFPLLRYVFLSIHTTQTNQVSSNIEVTVNVKKMHLEVKRLHVEKNNINLSFSNNTC